MRLKLICTALLCSALAASGCGLKKESAPPTRVKNAQQANIPMTFAPRLGGFENECWKLSALQTFGGLLVDGAVPSYKQLEVLEQLAEIAPAKVRGDFELLVRVGRKLASLHLRPDELPSPAQTAQIQQLETGLAKLVQAAQGISLWVQTCENP